MKWSEIKVGDTLYAEDGGEFIFLGITSDGEVEVTETCTEVYSKLYFEQVAQKQVITGD